MRTPIAAFTLALLSALAIPAPTSAAPLWSEPLGGPQLDVSLFYNGLSSYGDWVELPDYGWSFAPRVDPSWRPYTRGQWVFTDDGWYWDSDEEFGWAAYHYGRWVNDRYYGWVWIPGTEWAPAWVSWRRGNGYTGWAPLPPRAIWQTRVGFQLGGLDIDAYIGSGDYAFVADRSFMDRGVYQRIMPEARNLTIINVTANVTDYGFVNDRIVNRGVPVSDIEQSLGRKIARTRTVEVNRVDAPRRSMTGDVAIYRPSIKAAPRERPARGLSIVKGDTPPPFLVERRKVREQERRERGGQAETTAKDAARRAPAVREAQPSKARPPVSTPRSVPPPDRKVRPVPLEKDAPPARPRPEPTRSKAEPRQQSRPEPRARPQPTEAPRQQTPPSREPKAQEPRAKPDRPDPERAQPRKAAPQDKKPAEDKKDRRQPQPKPKPTQGPTEP